MRTLASIPFLSGIHVGGTRGLVAAVALASVALAPASDAQHGQRRGGGMETFEEVDPYTEGDPERMERLGYTAFGPFHWRGPDFTNHVVEAIGSIPMLWVETEHFKIGSSLGTYEIPNDREERDRIEDELDTLEDRLGRLRPPRKELDPWLRLHLYAQRAEALYAMFLEDFGIDEADFEPERRYLGNENKFLLLLCERKSEFGRFVRIYIEQENDNAYRWGWHGDCMFYGAAYEAITEHFVQPQEEPFDTMLYNRMASGLASNFIDGYRSQFSAPRWLGYALGHVYVRRIDPRWPTADGHSARHVRQEDDWRWEPQVYGLVKNDFFASTETMFGWTGYEDMNTRDHMIAWSKLQFLMTEADGDPKGWLDTLTSRPRVHGEDPEARRATMAELQEDALLAHFELTPEELDERWAQWVRRNYDKR